MKKILLFLLTLVSISSFGQLIQKNTTYGLAFNRTGADSLLYMPRDTFRVPTNYLNYNWVARKATTIYLWNTSTHVWEPEGNSGISNFFDSSVYHLNDSTLIICNAAGSCDTISLGNSFSYYFLNDSTIVTCDTTETICIVDSCYQQTICDTIPIPTLRVTEYQNGLMKPTGHIVEWGSVNPGNTQADLRHDTYLNTDYWKLKFSGRPIQREVLAIENGQWVSESQTIFSLNHKGPADITAIDGSNNVKLYFNYTDPMRDDTSGYMKTRIGYMINTNGGNSRYNMAIDHNSSKQSGIMFHTLDTSFTDAVTIFGTQTPISIPLYNNPGATSFLDKRIAVFKTTKQVQLPGYGSGTFTGTATKNLQVDVNGNIIEGAVSGGSQTLQQVFDVETGEALLNKNDTINIAANTFHIRSAVNGDFIRQIVNGNVTTTEHLTGSSVIQDADNSANFFKSNSTLTTGGSTIYSQVSNSGKYSELNINPDSINLKPNAGQINIDSLRTAFGDTTTWKPLVWSPSNKGVKKFNSWGEIGLGGTPTLQQVLTAGSTLTTSNTIVNGTNLLAITSTGTGTSFTARNSSSGIAFEGRNTADGVGVYAYNSNNGTGLLVQSAASALPVQVQTDGSTNSSKTMIDLVRTSSAPAAGIGASIDFNINYDADFYLKSNRIVSKWTTVSASPVAEMDIIGRDATEKTYMNIQTGGIVRVNNNADTLATKAYARSLGGGGGSPGGSTKQIQFNNSSAFGGAAGFEYQSGSSPNVLIQAQNAAHVALNVKAAGSQSTDIQQWQNSSGTVLSRVDPGGGFRIEGGLSNPVGGAANEIFVSGGSAFYLGYNRTGGSYVTTILDGFTKINYGGNTKVTMGALGAYIAAGTATPNSTLQVGGAIATAYLGTATGITLDETHSTVNVTATGQTITLPTAVGITGRIYTIKLTASGSCTVATTSSQNIDASTTYSLASQYKYVTVQSNGANWIVIANN